MAEDSRTSRDELGRFSAREVNLAPDADLGYVLGLVIGDGFIHATKAKNYKICLETTRNDYADLFARIVKKRFPGLAVCRYRRERTRRFPNGTVVNTPSFVTYVSSKRLYQLLRPFKQEDYHWEVPRLVLVSKDATKGFLQGIFDAEGSVDDNTPSIRLYSKHKENLAQVRNLLSLFQVKSWIKRAGGELRISSKGNCIRFQNWIGFRYGPKAKKLSKVCQVKYASDIVEKAAALRQQGYTYRKIAIQLGVKDPTSVREWLTGEKLPHSVIHAWPT